MKNAITPPASTGAATAFAYVVGGGTAPKSINKPMPEFVEGKDGLTGED